MDNRSVVVDPTLTERLVLRQTQLRSPHHDELVVQVKAVSLNRGEVRMAYNYADAGWQPGWDFAGVVERAADNGAGPKPGERVVGMVSNGAWAQRVIAPVDAVAVLPAGVTFEQAATLPVAGLTALHALRQGGLILGRNVLITGATGGVGDYAIQLARHSGARTTAHIRRPDQKSFVAECGADDFAIGERLSEAARPNAPYDLIIESVGGQVLADALTMLTEGGVCVNFGVSESSQVTFDAASFFRTGRARLYGLILFAELKSVEPASIGLALLARMIQDGKLRPHISVVAGWEKVAEVAQQLIDRKYPGKAVLAVG